MCTVNLDPCEVWDEREVRARKPHVCSSCASEIATGERYVRHFAVFEGDPSHEKCCLACHAARREFAEAHNGTLPGPYFFPTLLAECISDGDSESEERWRPMLNAIIERTAEAQRRRTGAP